MSIVVHGKVLFRRDTQANWEYVNPILEDGEIGLDKTIRNFKVGDGVTTWSALPYWIGLALILDKTDDSLLAAGQPATYFINSSTHPGLDSTDEIITLSPDATGKLERYYDMPIVNQDTVGDGTGTFTGWKVTGHTTDGTTLSEDLIIIISGGTGGSAIPKGTAGGDLSGTYPNPAVAQINGITKAYYDPTSSIQTQLNGKQANLDFTPYDSANPAGFVNDAQVVNRVKVGRSASNFGLTASQSASFIYNNTGGDNTFTIGAWLNFLTGTGNVIVKLQWYDGHSLLQTKIFYESGDSAGTTYGGTNTGYAFNTKTIRVKDATTITVFTVATGTVLYEVGGFINKIVGDGGL